MLTVFIIRKQVENLQIPKLWHCFIIFCLFKVKILANFKHNDERFLSPKRRIFVRLFSWIELLINKQMLVSKTSNRSKHLSILSGVPWSHTIKVVYRLASCKKSATSITEIIKILKQKTQTKSLKISSFIITQNSARNKGNVIRLIHSVAIP